MQTLSALQLAQWLAAVPTSTSNTPFLLDVREPWEWDLCHLPQAVHMPMNRVPDRITELDPETDIVCICHHGMRSAQVGFFLERNGFTRVYNLAGGLHAWAEEVDTSMTRY